MSLRAVPPRRAAAAVPRPAVSRPMAAAARCPAAARPQRALALLLPLLAALLVLVLARPALAADDTLRIGSKRFTESYILAQVLAQAAAPHAQVKVLQGLGNTAIVHAALRSGEIDLYPEYVGTIEREILRGEPAAPASAGPPSLDDLNRRLAPLGLGAAVPFGFSNGYALAMREVDAGRFGIRTLSEMARRPALRLGLSNEFLGRADGWPGLARRYGFVNVPRALDHGLAYEALARRQVEAIDIYTTDAKIGRLGLRVLKDDLGYFPRYDAVVLYRLDVPGRFPAAWAALQRLAGTIDERRMISLNARAELENAAFGAIARGFLATLPAAPAGGAAPAPPGRAVAVAGTPAAGGGTAAVPAPHGAASVAPARPSPAADASPLPARGFLAKLFGADLPRLTLEHLGLVVASVAAAAALGIPLAVWVAPHARLRALVLGATGLLQTIPSLAMLAALISFTGRIGTLPALLALALYALLPVMRNTVTGLAGVPAGLKLSALALGMTPRQRLAAVELPLALPTILAGLRTATTIAIGTATIAAFIGAGGYGERIVTGLALNDGALLLAGALPAAALALLAEGMFELAEASLRRRRTGEDPTRR